MLARVLSSAVFGIEAFTVEVEVDIANGLPAFNIVGLPDTACRESLDRVRAAVKNSGIPFPAKKITVNLAPANIKKEGSGFDLAIAIGILIANENISKEAVEGKVFCGELSLDGKVRPISGVLPRASHLAWDGPNELYLPAQNSKEALCVEGIKVFGLRSLTDLLRHLKGELRLESESFVPQEKKERVGDFLCVGYRENNRRPKEGTKTKKTKYPSIYLLLREENNYDCEKKASIPIQ